MEKSLLNFSLLSEQLGCNAVRREDASGSTVIFTVF
jgi:hypothetical protein